MAPGRATPSIDAQQRSFFWPDRSSPPVDRTVAELSGLDVRTADDAWAVGDRNATGGVKTLVEHWDGTAWSVVASPSPGGVVGSSLAGVDAVSADDAWAVGRVTLHGGSGRTLIEHWNGSAWHRVPSPNPAVGGNGTELHAVSAVGPDDVWAVGYDDPAGPVEVHAVVLHWNGHTWAVTETKNPAKANRAFFDVSTPTATSGWAVGVTGPIDDSAAKALTEHWDGQVWHPVATPSPGSFYNLLFSVSVVAPGRAWAVGEFANGRRTFFPLVERLTAGRWTHVTVPGLGAGASLSAVSGDTPSDVWAVGSAGGRDPRAVLVHWDGHRWSTFHGPQPGLTTVLDVGVGGPTASWAVGYRFQGLQVLPVRERWNGHVWTTG